MHTPAGFEIGPDGRFFPKDWFAIVFSPSFPYRLAHTVTAFYITTGFVVLGVGAYLVRRDKSAEEARLMVRMALGLLIVLVPLQMVLGDMHGLNTLEHQPAKLAAIEGRYETSTPTPLTVFGIPDDNAAQMRYAIEIPRLGSLVLTHSWDGEIKGLKNWPADQRPPVAFPFFGFRIMVGVAMLMLGTVVVGWFLIAKGRIFETGWYLRLCQWVAPLGFVAVLAGWITTEVGRQPWTVYGHLKTSASVSPSLTGHDVLTSLIAYVVVYLIMFPAGIAFMASRVRAGIAASEDIMQPVEGFQPRAPVKAPPAAE
jgi:cytochrome d ubiquinol oxidase subunit I